MQNRTSNKRIIALFALSSLIAVFIFLKPPGFYSPLTPALVHAIRAFLLFFILFLVCEKFFKLNLPTKIVIGLLAGAIAGIFLKENAVHLQLIGTIFFRLISLIVVPLVFVSLLLGTASMGDIRRMGRIGGKTFAYFMVTTVIAAIIGLVLVNIFQPGVGVEFEKVSAESLNFEQGVAGKSFVQFVVDLVPANPFQSFIQTNMLQIIVLAMLCGIAITAIEPDKRKFLINLCESLSKTFIQIVHIALKIAPYGVFALIASAVGRFGIEMMLSLLKYGGVIIIGLVLHSALIISMAVLLIGKYSPLKFWQAMRPAIVVAFSTSSSNATLPVTMKCAEEGLKLPKSITSFVLPLGAAINLNGTAIYQSVSAVFIAQVFGIELSLVQMITIVFTAVLASVGAAGVPSSAVITLAMVLQTVGIPIEGIALVLGIERILDMIRTTVNIIGDASASIVINHTEKINLTASHSKH